MDILTDPPADYLEPESIDRPLEMVGIAMLVGAGMEIAMHSWLIDNNGLGIGTSVAIVLGIAGLIRGAQFAGYGASPLTLRLYGAAIVFGSLLAFRASPVLALVNLSCALGLTCLGVAMHKRSAPPVSISDYAKTGANVALYASIGTTLVIGRDLPELETGAPWATSRRVLVGIVIAVPVLLVFGGLFMSADEIFADSFRWLIDWEISSGIVGGVVLAGVLTWGTLGLMRHSVITPAPRPTRSFRGLGGTEALTMMWLVNGLFSLFVAFQVVEVVISYQSDDVSYSQQARNGFFQLVTVAAMVVALVLVLDWWVDADPIGKAKLRKHHLALIGFTGAILVSAVVRMWLYVDAFGLTELRFYTSAFMIWISFLLIWLVRTVLAGSRGGFVNPALVGLLVIALSLTMVNPDRRIASYNLNNQAQTGPAVDRSYLVTALSADAVPVVLDHLGEVGDACTQLQYLDGWSIERRTDVRSWNFSQSRASGLFNATVDDLGATCQSM